METKLKFFNWRSVSQIDKFSQRDEHQRNPRRVAEADRRRKETALERPRPRVDS
jgi:hypothetical protein